MPHSIPTLCGSIAGTPFTFNVKVHRVFNRTAARGEQLARDFGLPFGGTLGEFDAQRFDIAVNATAAGFRAPDVNPIAGQLAPHLVVMDVAFLPVKSRLVRDADAIGCRTLDGTRMLLHQFCGQIELYTGRAAPFDAMQAALFEEIARVG